MNPFYFLKDTIADAAKWRHSHFGTVSPICEQLENLHKRGTEADGRAAKFLETAEKAKGGVGFERAQAEWERIIDGAGGDWVHSRAMDTFRAELKVGWLELLKTEDFWIGFFRFFFVLKIVTLNTSFCSLNLY